METVTGALPHIELTPPEREPVALWDEAGVAEEERLYLGERTGLQRRRDVIDDWSVWIDRLEDIDPAVVAVSPRVQGRGCISRGEENEPIQIMGVIPRSQNGFVDIEGGLIEG